MMRLVFGYVILNFTQGPVFLGLINYYVLDHQMLGYYKRNSSYYTSNPTANHLYRHDEFPCALLLWVILTSISWADQSIFIFGLVLCILGLNHVNLYVRLVFPCDVSSCYAPGLCGSDY